jgi:hypothetical protein
VNLDFGLDPLFSWYVVLLCLSGIAMLAISAVKRSGQSTGVRAFNALVGIGFLGYGVYLGFIFTGESYLIFFQAFILPAILLLNFVRSLVSQRSATPAPQPPYPMQQAPQPPYPGQSPQQPYPYQQQPQQPQHYPDQDAQNQPR